MGGYLFRGEEQVDHRYQQVSMVERAQLDHFPVMEEVIPTDPPQITQQVVLAKSDDRLIDKSQVVKGYNFNHGVKYDRIIRNYLNIGFQATNMARSIELINQMLHWRLSNEPVTQRTPLHYRDSEVRQKTRCKIFLGFTANLVHSGLRESFRFLVEHRLVQCVVTSAGGIEADLLKCLNNTYLGSFSLSGKSLHKKRINRIGNLLLPNNTVRKFHEWLMPILDTLLEEQQHGVLWTPSKFIQRLGKEMAHKESICYWAYKNNLPIYCPAITDGLIGDCLYFHSYKNPGLVIDSVNDIKRMNNECVMASTPRTAMVILGGGTSKHHICNANLMGGGAHWSVFINSGNEFDGSDSGARPDEAKSWGKIKPDGEATKIYCDATLVFPLIMAETFAKYHFKTKSKPRKKKKK